MLSSLLLLASSDTTVVEDVTEGASETVENVADSAVDQLQSFGDLFSFFNLSNVLSIGARVLVIVLVLGLAYRGARILVNRAYVARYKVGSVSEESHKQLETSRRMVLSVIFYATIILGVMAVMGIFGFDIRALAASAGIAGAALVFISQNVILDWINGIFILVERQFSVGDYVKIGEYAGEVQSITIRHTVIKTDFNETVSIPNGDINIVVNYTQDPVTEFFDIRLHDATRLDDGKEALLKACTAVNHQFGALLISPCRILGVQGIAGPSVTMRLTFQSKKGDTYPILRALRETCLRELNAVGQGYPQRHEE